MLTDAQIAALIMAAPFMLLSFIWAVGDYLINIKAGR